MSRRQFTVSTENSVNSLLSGLHIEAVTVNVTVAFAVTTTLGCSHTKKCELAVTKRNFLGFPVITLR